MGIRGPRVGGGVTRDEVRQPGARRGPEPERAVDVDPGAVRVGDGDDRLEVVERSRVHLAGLRADDQRLPGVGEHAVQELGAHPPLVVHRHDELLGPSDPEQPKRAGQRHVALLPDDDPKRRRAGETLLAEVVADLLVHGLTGGGERGDVRHLAARSRTRTRSAQAARAARAPSAPSPPRAPRRRGSAARARRSDPRPRRASPPRAMRGARRRSRSRSSGPTPSPSARARRRPRARRRGRSDPCPPRARGRRRP